MSKGWNSFLHTDQASYGVIREQYLRVRLEARGAKLCVTFQQQLPDEPSSGFVGSVHSFDSLEHAAVLTR